MFKDTFKDNKDILTGKYVRINGRPARILGGGNQALKLGFRMPEGFSNKTEYISGFVSWGNATQALRHEVLRHVPKSEGQQTLL